MPKTCPSSAGDARTNLSLLSLFLLFLCCCRSRSCRSCGCLVGTILRFPFLGDDKSSIGRHGRLQESRHVLEFTGESILGWYFIQHQISLPPPPPLVGLAGSGVGVGGRILTSINHGLKLGLIHDLLRQERNQRCLLFLGIVVVVVVVVIVVVVIIMSWV